LKGHHKPLGEIIDYFWRIEFQMRGTAHMHSLLSIRKNKGIESDDVHSDNIDVQQRVIQFVNNVISGILVERDDNDNTNIVGISEEDKERLINDEKDPDFCVQKDFFTDNDDPRRIPFRDLMNENFHRHITQNGGKIIIDKFCSEKIQKQYRNLQFANQIHRCSFTCFKYCEDCNRKKCRFEFPRNKADFRIDTAVIVDDRDRKNRPRTRVMPATNNYHLNPGAVSPLYVIGHGGNHDIAHIANKRGAAEYCACYSAKVEAPDNSVIMKVLTKFYSRKQLNCDSIELKEHYKAVGSAIISSTRVGAVNAMWALMGLPFVNMSRKVIPVNPLPLHQVNTTLIIDKKKINEMNDGDSIINYSPGSQLGKRRLYHQFVIQQIELAKKLHNKTFQPISFFVLLTNYTLTILKQGKSSKLKEPSLIELNETNYSTCKLLAAKSFRINDCIYTKCRQDKEMIVSCQPHFPIDMNDDRCCYGLLLLHLPWSKEGEEGLLGNCQNSIERMHEANSKQLFSKYVQPLIKKLLDSEALLNQPNFIEESKNIISQDVDHRYELIYYY
jgi:hypothetical protein